MAALDPVLEEYAVPRDLRVSVPVEELPLKHPDSGAPCPSWPCPGPDASSTRHPHFHNTFFIFQFEMMFRKGAGLPAKILFVLPVRASSSKNVAGAVRPFPSGLPWLFTPANPLDLYDLTVPMQTVYHFQQLHSPASLIRGLVQTLKLFPQLGSTVRKSA